MERSAHGVAGTGIDEGRPAWTMLLRPDIVAIRLRAQAAAGSRWLTPPGPSVFWSRAMEGRPGPKGSGPPAAGLSRWDAASAQTAWLLTRDGWLALNLGAGGVQGPAGCSRRRTAEGHGPVRAGHRTRTWSVPLIRCLWVTSVQRGSGATTLYSSDDAGGTWHPLDLSAPG